MISLLMPTRWYYLTAASPAVPCRWEGWVDLGPSLGVRWMIVELFGA